MAERARIDPDELHRVAQLAALHGLQRGHQPSALVEVVARHHVPRRFAPDVAVLELAADALALACPPGSPPSVRPRNATSGGYRSRTPSYSSDGRDQDGSAWDTVAIMAGHTSGQKW